MDPLYCSDLATAGRWAPPSPHTPRSRDTGPSLTHIKTGEPVKEIIGVTFDLILHVTCYTWDYNLIQEISYEVIQFSLHIL